MIFRVVVFIVTYILTSWYMIWYEALALSLTLYFLLDLIQSIGQKMPFLEIITFYSFLIWVAMPVIAYQVFNEYDDLSALWVAYMTIPSEEYFSYALPAASAFAIGLKMPLYGNNWPMARYNNHLKKYLASKSYLGLYLIAIGFVSTFLVKISPEVIRNIVNNFAYLTYIGMFYVIYSPYEHKLKIVLICAGLTLSQSIASGMYGELFFLTTMSALILLAGKKISINTKLLVVAGGMLLVLLLQSIKAEYRESTWSGLERSADPALFGSLVWDRMTHPEEIFAPARMFNMYIRANQGNLVARAMAYVPKFEPYAHGETIFKAFAAALVPRFLWVDKPKAGGAEMVCKYLGDCGAAMRGISYNVGPIGEAYINFGRIGGMIFMFFYGLFFNFLFNAALILSKTKPSLILWFPLLFVSFFTMEKDVLSFVNTFAKSAIFTYVMYKSVKLFFKVTL